MWFAAESAEKVVASDLTLTDWLVAAAILAAGIAIGQLGRTILVRAVRSGDNAEEEPLAVRLIGRTVTTAAVVVAALWALSILGVRLGTLVGALGIGGLAIAFASQSILANFLSSVILQLRRPFRYGDWVLTNECEGSIEAINFRTVVLRTYEGERVMVPCAEVLSRPIVNYSTMGRRRTTLEVGVAYDTDLDKALSVLKAAASGADGVRDQPPVEAWAKGFGTSSIDLVVRFWHAPDILSMWKVRSTVAVAVKKALDEAGITIPFPQSVLHFATDTFRLGDNQSEDRAYWPTPSSSS